MADQIDLNCEAVQSLQGKVVLITGASSGIGLAMAKEFAMGGAQLVLLARRLDRLQALAIGLEALGTSVLVSRCDVTQEGDLEKSVAEAIQKFGRLDIVVAGAGFSVWGGLEKLSIDDYRRQFETNVFGVLRTIYATLSELKKTQGILTLIGSVSGYISLPGVSAYGMSKAAIHALANSIGPELRRQGVSVVLIAPGFVESEIRKVDNYGVLQLHATDPVSPWLQMPSKKAAQLIVSAILARKTEKVITFHGKVAVFVKRHFPGLISFLLNRRAFKWRSKSYEKKV